MKAKFGAIVVAGSGKLGGHVASRNRGGAYFRTKVTPVNPNTSAQAEVRSRLTSFSQAWRDLTDNQRASWNAAVANFAKTDIFGDLKNPSGFNLYQRLNNNLDQIGVAPLTSAPVPSEVVAVTELSVAADESASSLTITYAPTPVPADTAFIIRATPGLSPGVNFVKSEYRVLTFAETANVSPLAAGALWEAMFGELTEGTKIFVSIEPMNAVTGQKGIAVSASTIVVA